MTTRSKLAVILHADVVGSTALVQLDEKLAHERIRSAFDRFSGAITRYGGHAHEVRGDAIVAEFNRASDAVGAGLAFQAENKACNQNLSGEIRPELRIGIALGEVVIADGTITGAGVVLAQRLEQLANSGSVVVQGAVFETVPNRFPFSFEFIGEHSLKGFDQPVRAHSVTLAENSTMREPEIADPSEEPISNSSNRRTSIAVLPFANLASHPEQEYISDGITEDLITALSRYRWFFVIASGTSFTYKGAQIEPARAGNELGVEYVVSGSVRRAEDRFRLNVQLSETATGNQLWNQRFDRQAADIFALQDELSQSIAGQLEPELASAERHRAGTRVSSTSTLWESYQRGMWYIAQVDDAERLKAKQHFLDAIEIDPRFAQGLAVLSYVFSSEHSLDDGSESISAAAQAIEYGRRAIQADHRNAYGHFALGRALGYGGDWDRALPELRLAVELNPSFAMAYDGLGEAFLFLDRFEEALVYLHAAMALSPHDPRLCYTLTRIAAANYYLGRYEEAIDSANRSIELKSDFLWNRLRQIAALAQLGRSDEASQSITEAKKIWPDLSLGFVEKRAQSFRRTGMLKPLRDGLERAGLSDTV